MLHLQLFFPGKAKDDFFNSDQSRLRFRRAAHSERCPQVLYVLLEDHSPHVSGAAAVYLLAIVQRCKDHPVLAAYLSDVQAAFTRKLTVR